VNCIKYFHYNNNNNNNNNHHHGNLKIMCFPLDTLLKENRIIMVLEHMFVVKHMLITMMNTVNAFGRHLKNILTPDEDKY
jgi:hypothetical protein